MTDQLIRIVVICSSFVAPAALAAWFAFAASGSIAIAVVAVVLATALVSRLLGTSL